MLICSYRLSLVFFKFLHTLVHSYGILVSSHVSLYRNTFARCYCRQINCSRCVRLFVQYLSYLLNVSPYVSSFVQYLSYLLNVSPYVSSFVQYLSYLLNVSPYVSSFVQY